MKIRRRSCFPKVEAVGWKCHKVNGPPLAWFCLSGTLVEEGIEIRMRGIKSALLLGILLVAFLLASVRLVRTVDVPNSDFFTFWLAGRLALTGEDPYSPDQWVQGHHDYGATWIPNQTLVYPLPLAYLMVPIGALPLYDANVLWVFFSMVMVLASIALITRPGNHLPWNLFTPLIAGVYLLRPTLVTFRNGQLGALLLLILVGTMVLWRSNRWFAGGAVLALLWLKPSIALPFLPLTAAWAVLTRKPRGISGIAMGTAALTIAGWAADPSWVGDYLSIGARKLAASVGYAPSLWGLVGLACQSNSNCVLRIGLSATALLLLGFALFVFKFPDRLSPSLLLACVVSVSLFATPYIWAYDQVLLALPLSVVVEQLSRLRRPYLVCAIIPLLFSLGSLMLLVVAFQLGSDAWSGVLSLSVLGLAIWIALQSRQGWVA